MKLLIFFLIFFLLFTPHVKAEDNYSLQLMFSDLSGEIIYEIQNLSGELIHENGTSFNFFVENFIDTDGTINKTFISNENFTLGNYTCIIYQWWKPKDSPENLVSIRRQIGKVKFYFQNPNNIQLVPLYAINGVNENFAMYNMANESLKLSKTSEDMSEKSFNISLAALFFTIIGIYTPAFKKINKLFKRPYIVNDLILITFATLLIIIIYVIIDIEFIDKAHSVFIAAILTAYLFSILDTS